MKIVIAISYDGTNYFGWQRQDGETTVEGTIEDTLKYIFHKDIDIMGASRTDAGVHSNGSIAVFDIDTKIPADRISYVINKYLPEDIRIIFSKEIQSDFNIRKTKTEKTYTYRISLNRIESPTLRLYYHTVHTPLLINEMKKAKKYLEGTHDFKSFSSTKTNVKNFVRTISEIKIEIEKPENEFPNKVAISVTGNGFLYNMVRIIVGTLIEVGQGKIKADDIKTILLERDRTKAGHTAPAKGLTLERSVFPEIGIDTDRFR